MKNTIILLFFCVSLTQGFTSFAPFRRWRTSRSWNAAAKKVMSSIEDHQGHAQRLLDEIEDMGVQHFAKKERCRNKVGKLWMKFKSKAKVNLETAKEYIDEVEEELNSNPVVPEHAKKVIKDVRQQTRHVVKSLKKLIRPIKLSIEESDFEIRRPIETPEIVEAPELPEPTEEPEILSTELPEPTEEPEVLSKERPEPTEEPEVLSTELPDPTEEPEVLPTELPDPTEEPEVLSTELPEPTEEPEVLPTELPEPTEEPKILLTELPEPTEELEVLPTERPEPTKEPEVLSTGFSESEETTLKPEREVDPVDEEHFIDEGDDTYADEEYDENEDENDNDDGVGDVDKINEDSTAVPTEKEKEPEREKEVHEVVEIAKNMEVQRVPKWKSKRQKKLTKLWEKYALRNNKKVLKKIKKLESLLSRKIID